VISSIPERKCLYSVFDSAGVLAKAHIHPGYDFIRE
jgi:hypothetical protein